MRIALIGFMGAGKTALGRKLAQKYGLDFIDTDAEIVRDTGRSLDELFKESEKKFREKELEKLAEVSRRDNAVLSTGGGTMQTDGSLKYLKDWTVVYLSLPIDTAYNRSVGVKMFMRQYDGFKELCEQRAPLFERICDFEIYTGDEEEDSFERLCRLTEIEIRKKRG